LCFTTSGRRASMKECEPCSAVGLPAPRGRREIYGLERDLRIAISEYAPQSEVVAGGFKWRSYALKLVPNHAWPRHDYGTCKDCGFTSGDLRRQAPPFRAIARPVAVRCGKAPLSSLASGFKPHGRSRTGPMNRGRTARTRRACSSPAKCQRLVRRPESWEVVSLSKVALPDTVGSQSSTAPRRARGSGSARNAALACGPQRATFDLLIGRRGDRIPSMPTHCFAATSTTSSRTARSSPWTNSKGGSSRMVEAFVTWCH